MSGSDRDPARAQPAAGAHLRIARPTDRLDQLVGIYRDGPKRRTRTRSRVAKVFMV